MSSRRMFFDLTFADFQSQFFNVKNHSFFSFISMYYFRKSYLLLLAFFDNLIQFLKQIFLIDAQHLTTHLKVIESQTQKESICQN